MSKSNFISDQDSIVDPATSQLVEIISDTAQITSNQSSVQQLREISSTTVFNLQDESELIDVVQHIVALLISCTTHHQITHSIVITLSGDLGSGKTTFTKQFARTIGIEEILTSPTFVIQKSYAISPTSILNTFDVLTHIDAYRLNSADDLRKISFDSLLTEGTRNVICIEWPEIVHDIIPASRISVQFEHREGTMRKVTVTSNL